ncbi:2,4-dienoyl-CoA reductase-like NADH-dependent reductase (Old Yellow Enzyme family)/NADPH-dependent 2,4-dienoyl-CoA reductase/sulfur reductase-like enzyme [Litorivivens lipolytica]|uniref:2,4-dienoyl-CoA reductase-like NADH-dependent reductase (Old Yellow Enzyme family)/NADPH-dependent 2,4-dienoyl-CoA reductase/sulfur reductase-like enzyme n=1 Tax=Litorivivens lipolytica TaxID=1524264 RepID=A0A7W4Z574_9GAMM|nr:FAD-dependent oxidoreductase [Litorivivens lipolytica]MBB3046847.1 2,4-dienoyl-CoA reductase-like NADH-dependent reductase (Old Yellow Enzyme family)/NADPH-dependent 2,4-dienoyl-CoA reductase/sulfur reductase-like enzyme [Litorivivens lipolytica]
MFKNYNYLLQPGRIGSLNLKNRMFVTAMGVNLAEADGHCGERIRAFHEEQAKGGAALVTLGVAGVAWPHGGNMPRQVAISDDKFIPGLRDLADAVHRHDAKIISQLHFGGLVGVEDMKHGRPVWIPSMPVFKQSDLEAGMLKDEIARSATSQKLDVKLHPMTKEDIEVLVQKFADGARRVREAGMDGLEIHGGHGYLISEFLSPLTNQRDDEYGGSVENRARLLMDIIAAVRKEVGRDFPIWCKLDSEEFGQADGISLEDAKIVARMAQDAGMDAITVSAYHDTSRGALHSESNIPHTPERLVANATAIKQVLDIPVITSGRIEPEHASKHIGEGHFDFFGMGRKLLADPHLPRKLAENRAKDIRPCVYCYCCVSQIYLESPVKCAVNPDTAFETDNLLAPADKPRRIAVIGGGPGGMEAARRLTLRGHDVVLLEKSHVLGGTLQFAAIAYEPNGKLLDWLKGQIRQLPINVHLNTEATPELLKRLGIEEVVVATGATRSMPAIPGADKDFVFSGDEMRAMVLGEKLGSLRDKLDGFSRFMLSAGSLTGASQRRSLVNLATRHWMPLGDKVVIIGGELVGLELAEYLAHRGKQVTVLEESSRPGAGLYLVRRLRLLDELREEGVTLISKASEIAIGDQQVAYRNYRGQIRHLGADHVVVAKGAEGNLSLADKLSHQGFSVHTVGDCSGVTYIEGAMHDAARVAATI